MVKLRKNKGQEAIEFALVSVLVFFVSLFALMILGSKISSFFQDESNPMNQSALVANSLTTTIPSDNPGFMSTPSTNVQVDIGGGQSVSLDIPDTSYYITNTTGASGMMDAIQSASNLTKVLSDSIQDLATATQSSTLAELSKLMSDTATMETGYLNYDSSIGDNWLKGIDPSSASFAEDLTSSISSLSKTLEQIKDENASHGSWDNSITGVNQDDVARQLQDAISAVNGDPTLTDDVKELSTLLTSQVQTLADNNDYVIDEQAFEDAVDAFVKLGFNMTAVQSSQTQADRYDIAKANAVVDLFSTNNTDLIPQIDQLTIDEKEKMYAALQTLHVEVIQPPEAVVDTYLAAKSTCIAGGGSWDSGSNSCQ